MSFLNFKFSAAVAEFGLLLRHSSFKSEATYDQVVALAQAGFGQDAEGYQSEFVRLVETAQLLNDR